MADADRAQIDLDRWLAEPQVRTRHRCHGSATPQELWRAAGTIRIRDAPRIGRVLRWRIPNTPAELTFREVFRRYPFTVLDEGDGWSVSGLCGRVWSLRRDYPRLAGAEEFRAWSEPATVRVVFAHWVVATEDGAALVSESRVEPVDGAARWRMRALWASLGHFERLIGGEALRVAAERAEGR
jgi:hypothetical protein